MVNNETRAIDIDLSISSSELMKLYRGSAKQVVGTALSGEVIRFPALRLQPFVTREGVYGRFRLIVDAANKLQRIERLA